MRCASIKTLTEGRNKSGSQLLRQLEAETWCWGKNNHRAFIITDPLGRGVIKYTLPSLTVHYSFSFIMSLSVALSLLAQGNNGDEILTILDTLVSDIEQEGINSCAEVFEVWCNSLCALWLTLGGSSVIIVVRQCFAAVASLRGGALLFLGPSQPTEVTNRPIDIILIKFFRKYDKSSKPPQI